MYVKHILINQNVIEDPILQRTYIYFSILQEQIWAVMSLKV